MPELSQVGGNLTGETILLLGNPGVGKTAIVKKWVENQFQEKYEPTIGVKFHKKASLVLFDFSGAPLFKEERKWYYTKEGIVMFIIDLTRRETLKIDDWIKEVKENVEEILPVLIANKADLKEEREISTEEAKKLASKISDTFNKPCPYLEISAKKSKIDELFEKINFPGAKQTFLLSSS